MSKLSPTAHYYERVEDNAFHLLTAVYFFGVEAAGAAAPAAPSSIPNVQCASTFLPSDFAVRITVQLLSRSFWVT
jgi:hypothetical protein